MSPRHNRRQHSGPVARGDEDDDGAMRRASQAVEGDWMVRTLPANPTTGKTYRCPGCDQEVPASQGHIVAWRLDSDGEDRRHWHTSCWRTRGHRLPNIQRGRSAPKY
ncbi:ATP/GTP-binding protein [Longispora urticae]